MGYGKNNVVENGNADMIGHSFWSMKLLFKLFFDGIIFGMIPQSLVIVPSQSFSDSSCFHPTLTKEILFKVLH